MTSKRSETSVFNYSWACTPINRKAMRDRMFCATVIRKAEMINPFMNLTPEQLAKIDEGLKILAELTPEELEKREQEVLQFFREQELKSNRAYLHKHLVDGQD